MVVALVYVLIIANTLTVPIVMLFAPYLARLTLANPAILAPIVIWVAMLAAYMTTNSVADLLVVLIFAALGLFMKAYGWPRPPILIAVALGEIMEKYLWIAVNNYGFSMFLRPQFLSILAVMGLVALAGVRMRRQARATVQEMQAAVAADGLPSAPVVAAALPGPATMAAPAVAAKIPLRDRLTLEFAGELVLLALVAAFLGYMLWDSTNWRFSDRLTPLIGITIAGVFWVIRVGTIVLSFFRPVMLSSREATIMDTGFQQGQNPAEARERFFQIFGFTVGIALAVWVFGFHIGGTLLLAAYLFFVARLSLFWTAVICAVALAILVGFYDQVLGIPWHVPLIAQVFK